MDQAGRGYDLQQAVLDTVALAIVACDAEGRLTVFNPAARSIHGVPPDGSIDPAELAKHFDLFVEDGSRPLETDEIPLLRVLSGEPVIGEVIRIAPPDGPAVVVSCDGRQLFDADGVLSGAVVAMTDITRSRRVAKVLQRERDRAEAIVRSSSHAYVSIDVRRRITAWNPAATAMLGWADHEALGHDAVDRIVPSTHREESRARWDRLLADGVPPGGSWSSVLLHASGAPLSMEISGWFSGEDEERVLNLFLRDESERLRIARETAEQHAELTSALDAMPRSITLCHVVRDREGRAIDLRVAWTNAHVMALLGCDLTEVVGRPFGSVFPLAARRFLETWLAAAEAGRPVRLPTQSFDGDLVHGAFDVTIAPWGADGIMIDVADVTEQHRVEAALRASEHQLRRAQELAGLAGWDWDLRTNELSWSPLMHAMLGIDPAITPTPQLMRDLLHPDDRDAFAAAAAAAREAADSTEISFRVVRPDGEVVRIRSVVTIDRDAAGQATRVWGANQDVTSVVEREERLSEAARQDPLTGLLNRRGWDHEVELVGPELPCAVVMLDLDHFKLLNDTAGHAAGDAVLVACAQAWQRRLRRGDVLARMGGEEFALLLPGCGTGAAERLVEALRALVPGPTTASAGIAHRRAGESVQDALARADAALYAAKNAGRDRVLTAA